MFESTLRLVRFRGLLATLVARELKARYRGSVLGFLWSLVTPLILLAVYTFVFSFIFQPRLSVRAYTNREFLGKYKHVGECSWLWSRPLAADRGC